MTRIVCREPECIFWEEGVCSAEEIEYDPDAGGCLAFEEVEEVPLDEVDLIWEEEEEEEEEEAEEEEETLGDEDDWEDEEEWEDEEDDLYEDEDWDDLDI